VSGEKRYRTIEPQAGVGPAAAADDLTTQVELGEVIVDGQASVVEEALQIDQCT
jgi:hypothetical protein